MGKAFLRRAFDPAEVISTLREKIQIHAVELSALGDAWLEVLSDLTTISHILIVEIHIDTFKQLQHGYELSATLLGEPHDPHRHTVMPLPPVSCIIEPSQGAWRTQLLEQ